MDTKNIIHIGSELVIIGGLTFYFSSQISSLRRENEALINEIKTIKQALTEHAQILRYFHGDQIPQVPISSPSSSSQTPKFPPSKRPGSQRLKVESNEEDWDESSGYTEEELDKRLHETFNDLNLSGSKVRDLKKTNSNPDETKQQLPNSSDASPSVEKSDSPPLVVAPTPPQPERKRRYVRKVQQPPST